MRKKKKCAGTAGFRLIFFAAACLAAFPSCSEESRVPAVGKRWRTMTVAFEERTRERSFPAVLRGCRSVEIRPRIGGVIERICVDEGARVSKGQVLFVIDRAPYAARLDAADAAVRLAEARLEAARLEFAADAALGEKEIVSERRVQMTRAALDAAAAELECASASRRLAEAELSRTVLTSPVDGVAGMSPYRVGAIADVNAEEPLLRVSDDGEIFAYFSVAEEKFSPEEFSGAEVFLRLSDGSDYAFAGTLNAVSGTVDPRTGTLSVRAAFPNPERRLRDGGSARVVFRKKEADAIVIPQTATVEIQGRVFVYKVEDGRATRVPVVAESSSDGGEFFVREGLSVGDVIISAGAGLAREGEPVPAGDSDE